MNNNRDNLRQAAKDLFGKDAAKGKDPVDYTQDPAYQAAMAATYGADTEAATAPAPIIGPSDGSEMSEMIVLEPRKQTSVIAEGTTIAGRIRSNGHIEIMGKVDGNVEAEGDVTVCGKVAGNIKGDQLKLLSCQVKGNLDADDRIVVNSDSIIIGDVQSDSIVLDGKLKGNVNVNKTAVFNSNSYLLGDITTTTLSIDAGAVINGMVKTYVDFDADSPFDKL